MASEPRRPYVDELAKSALQAAQAERTTLSAWWGEGEDEYKGVVVNVGDDYLTIEESATHGVRKRRHQLTFDEVRSIYFWNPP